MKQIPVAAAILALGMPAVLACPMNTTAQSHASDYVVAHAEVPMSTAADAIDADAVTGSTDDTVKLPGKDEAAE